MTESKTGAETRLRKIKVEFFGKKQHLYEIGQVTGMQYAFLSSKADGYKQCHQWIKCRDFLHDALRSRITGKVEQIFGFSYDPKTDPPIDLKRMRLLIKRDRGLAKETRKMIDSAIDIINCIEKSSGIKPLSKLYQASSNDGVYIFMGASDWMESTFMISLYTFLIRLGAKNIEFTDKEDLYSKLKDLKGGDHDINYLKTVYPFLDKIIENRKKLKYVGRDGKVFFDKQNINMFHGYTGIVALCTQAKAANPRAGNNNKLEELISLSDLIREKKDVEIPKEMKKV